MWTLEERLQCPSAKQMQRRVTQDALQPWGRPEVLGRWGWLELGRHLQSWGVVCTCTTCHPSHMSSVTPWEARGIGRTLDAGRRLKGEKVGTMGESRAGAGAEGTVICWQRVGRGRDGGVGRGKPGLFSKWFGICLVWDSPRSLQAHLPGRPWVSWTGVIATGLGWQEEQRLCTAPGGHTDPPQCEPDVTPVSA